MNCDDTRRLLADYYDGLLGDDRRCDVEDHIKTCSECSAKLAALQSLRDTLLHVSPQILPDSLQRHLSEKTKHSTESTFFLTQERMNMLGRTGRIAIITIVAGMVGITFLAFTFTLVFGSRLEKLDVLNIKTLLAASQGNNSSAGHNPTYGYLPMKAETSAPKAYEYLPRPGISTTEKRYDEDSLEQVVIQPIVVTFSQEYREVEAKLYLNDVIADISERSATLGLSKDVVDKSIRVALGAAKENALPSYVEKARIGEQEVLLIVTNSVDKRSGGRLSAIAVFAVEPATRSIVANWPSTPLSQDVDLRNMNPHKSLSCIACHPNFEGSTKALKISGWKAVARRTCSRCHSHEKQYKTYAKSIHGQLALAGRTGRGGVKAPACGDCHDAHATLASNKKPRTVAEMSAYAKNVCGNCHPDYWESYDDYYHGKGYKASTPDAPACWDCHGYHDIQPSSHPDSHVAPANLTKTCVKCHDDADFKFVEYGKMVHGRARERENSPIWQRLNQGIEAIKGLLE